MPAPRTEIFRREFVGLDFKPADFAAPDRFFGRGGLGLGFDVFLIVVVGEGFLIGEEYGTTDFYFA